MKNELKGTLAIDLGNTNTVLAFQSETERDPILIDIPHITSKPGVVPTAIWYEPENNLLAIGVEALNILKITKPKLVINKLFLIFSSLKVYALSWKNLNKPYKKKIIRSDQ